MRLQDRKNTALIARKARKAAAKIIQAGAGEEIAKRIKDAGAWEKACLIQLDSEREFAGLYKQMFPEKPPPSHTGPGRGNKTAAPDSGAGVLGEQDRENWCKSFGFALRTVQRWFVLLDDKSRDEKKAAIVKRAWELGALWQAANFSSESIEWYTPERYLEAVREVLGEIDLDPASNHAANLTVCAKQIYTKEDDGLIQSWSGRVFMNPPYGKTEDNESLAGAFCVKAAAEYEAGNIDACVVLINSLHSQAWQAPLFRYPICLVDHRIQFVSGDGETNKSPTFQNMFVYMGKDEAKFYEAFKRFGYIMKEMSR